MTDDFGNLNVVAGAAEIAGGPVNYFLTRYMDKRMCGIVMAPMMIAGLLINGFVTPNTPVFIIYIAAILYNFGFSGPGFVISNIQPDVTDVDELITGRRREGVIGTFNTFIKKTVSGVMSSVVMFILGGFGLIVGDELKDKLAVDPNFQQSDSALLGVRLCVAIIPIILTLISLFLLHKFRMNKAEHRMVCAAIATKHRYGNVTLTAEQIKIVEDLTGQKYENTWLGQNNEGEEHTVEVNENGEYDILVEKEAEMAAIRNGKKVQEAQTEETNESIELTKEALGE